ncbi:efflux RND transporter periplasmic adaptor subunit [Chitiniphilus purpureus]|uniref:Efflux RND transporter periplasmic adaptor subunit n=1 Tax=Chitiniphilus purpureus TaxID=2981137 RepID=A0ABY6DPB3_9NEIS|nr:efflux RND transporter periplasmic adaptor subunit [Chitiniphilus sp. CD1]UXY16224.1 efflux RND transporter periplasmic adaptor subunit [Chitiniphilus sp. CD1]
MNRISWSVPTGTLLLALSLAGCGKPPQEKEALRPVRVMQVAAPGAAPGVELSGTVRADVETPLAFRIGGKLLERQVEVGAVVRRGQVIARIDPRDVALGATAASAEAAAAAARLAQAKMDYERAQQLFSRKFVSQAEVDNRKTALDAAQEAVRQANAQRVLAQNQASYAALTADADGVITEVAAEPGQVLAAGQPVATLARNGLREIAVNVPEQLRGSVQLGQPVQIRLWALPGQTLKGRISELSPAADPVARTYPARVTFDGGGEGVQLGMSASVTIANGSVAVGKEVRVPLTALFGETGRQQVWRFDPAQGVVRAMPVKVLGVADEAALVSGVPVGALVVTAGAHLLREGQQVKRLAERSQGAGA